MYLELKDIKKSFGEEDNKTYALRGVSFGVEKGAFDYHTSKDILQLLDGVNRKYGTTVIMVTHNEALAEMADRVIRVKDGMIVKNDQNPVRVSVADLEW